MCEAIHSLQSITLSFKHTMQSAHCILFQNSVEPDQLVTLEVTVLESTPCHPQDESTLILIYEIGYKVVSLYEKKNLLWAAARIINNNDFIRNVNSYN